MQVVKKAHDMHASCEHMHEHVPNFRINQQCWSAMAHLASPGLDGVDNVEHKKEALLEE